MLTISPFHDHCSKEFKGPFHGHPQVIAAVPPPPAQKKRQEALQWLEWDGIWGYLWIRPSDL